MKVKVHLKLIPLEPSENMFRYVTKVEDLAFHSDENEEILGIWVHSPRALQPLQSDLRQHRLGIEQHLVYHDKSNATQTHPVLPRLLHCVLPTAPRTHVLYASSLQNETRWKQNYSILLRSKGNKDLFALT